MLIVKGGPPQKIGKTQSVHNLPQESHLIKLNPILTLKTEGCFDGTLNQIYNSVGDTEYVHGRIFKQLILFVDTKFSELTEKIDNFDNLSDINTHLLRIQSSQVSPIMKQRNDDSPNDIVRNKSSGSLLQQDNTSLSDKGKNSPSRKALQRNSLSQSNVMDINRLNQFEKKIRQTEDKQIKFEQDQQDKFQGFQNRIEKLIRSIQEKQQSLQFSDLYRGIQEFSENQKQIVSFISTSQNEMIEINKKLLSTSKEYQEQMNFVKNSQEQNTQAYSACNEKIETLSTSIQQIDQDLLIILKCYKDVLNDVFRIEILEQQQKRILNILNNYH
ncbi:unnamed protein product [Paramecium octaurelia]|uniref:Uncharacterized protein n=1 Tax=Paramecium octaurelia TaxID=43137 RepID=A0A8S1UIN9_PAROT|nr:unnamed protein product [Paramecium octaurelia]